MLDWVSAYIGYDASAMPTGRFFKTDRHGEIVYEKAAWETEVGSHESGVQVTKTIPTARMIEDAKRFGFLCSHQVLNVSGNPTKFLQGHNVTGPSVSQLGPIVQAMVRAFREGIRPLDADEIALPAVHRSRVDVTTAVDLGSHDAVHEWLQLAEGRTRSKHGRAQNSAGTVYIGKNSTRWSLKFYCKHCELKAHPPVSPSSLAILSDLLEWTRPHLRIELTLRRPELKERGSLDESIIWEFFKRVEMHTMQLKPISAVKLRTPVMFALESWYGGTDLKVRLPHRTLYKYRKEILLETGIDILLPANAQSNVAQPVLLGLDELRRREVVNIPASIQRSLFGAGV